MTKMHSLRLLNPLFKFISRHPRSLLVVILAGGLWFAYESLVARPAMSYMGLPKVESGIATQGWSPILRHEGYLLEYSEKLANPLWVTYQVSEQRFKSGKRPSGFKTDWRSISGISHSGYTGSGYDRGHMVSDDLIVSRYGRSAQQESFLMINISSQKPNLNQKSWQRLEEIISNDFSQWHGNVWVVTGPI